MKKRILITLLFLMCLSALACWFTETTWQSVYIASVNETSTVPTGIWPTITAPECGVINFPATVWIKIQPSPTNQIKIDEVLLQWKIDGEITWKTINLIEDIIWVIDYDHPVALFGKYNLSPAGILPGDKILIRLQVTDAVSMNAQIDVDTTDQGTNCVHDQWVVSMTVGTTRRH